MTNNENASETNNKKQAAQTRQRRANSAPAQGQAILPDNIEPWNEAVDPKMLLDELVQTFNRFAILPKHCDTALALWVAFTWCVDALQVSPILALCSPEKQCGKTTVLSLVGKLSARPLRTSNISMAAIFRVIEMSEPTLLIDEADTFIRESEEMRGILNSGHTRDNAFVIRVTGENHEPRQFSTWSPKAIALIGKLPDTLHDRSIVVNLRRKIQGETTEKLRHMETELFEVLNQKLKRFADDNLEALSMHRPTPPDTVSDRSADNWEPLLSIAALAGKEWQERALKALEALSDRENDASSIGTDLLADIEIILGNTAEGKISSSELIIQLCSDDEKSWLTYNRGKPITPRQVVKILSQYGIASKTIRLGHLTPKGFDHGQFEDAFNRYLHGSSESAATTPQVNETNDTDVADTASWLYTLGSRPVENCGDVADILEDSEIPF